MEVEILVELEVMVGKAGTTTCGDGRPHYVKEVSTFTFVCPSGLQPMEMLDAQIYE